MAHTATVVIGAEADDDRWPAGVTGLEGSWLLEPGVRVVTGLALAGLRIGSRQ